VDIYEETAHILEDAQYARFRKSVDKDKFFDNPTEVKFFEQIKALRLKSKTYHKDNAR
jgi:hypothetical protein